MKYKSSKIERFNPFFKTKSILIELKQSGFVSPKKFFWLLGIFNKKKTYGNFNKIIYKKLFNIYFCKRLGTTSRVAYNKFFIKTYFKRYKKLKKLLDSYNIDPETYIKKFKTKPKRLVIKSLVHSMLSNISVINRRSVFLNLYVIIKIFLRRILCLNEKKDFLYSIKKKDLFAFKSFIKNVKLLKILSYQFSKNKFKFFLLKKRNKFFQAILKKILCIFFSYRYILYKKRKKIFRKFSDITIRFILKLMKINHNTEKVFPTMKHLFLPKKESFISSDKTVTDLYKKIVGLIQKKGNKTKSEYILSSALFLIKKKLKMPTQIILLNLFKKLKTSVEPRVVRVRRQFHDVPCPVSHKRKTFLIAKWLLKSIEKDKKKISIITKLKRHILKVICTSNSLPYKTKKYIVHKTIENRSNSHYRWW